MDIPDTCSPVIALSRPAPGPLTRISTSPHTHLGRLFGDRFSGPLSGKRSALATSFESHSTRRRPANHVAGGVCHRDDRVVERRLDVGNALIHITTNLLLLYLCHAALSFNCQNEN